MEHAILPFRYALCRIELAVNARLRRIGTIAIIITGLVVAAVLGYPDIIEAITKEAPVEDPGIPVSFRSEEHTSELQSLMRNSYAVFCLKKKKQNETNSNT